MSFKFLTQIENLSKEQNVPFWRVILNSDIRERQVSKEESFENMKAMYYAMKEADRGYDKNLKSTSGLVGGDGEKLLQYRVSGKSMMGDFVTEVMEKAVKMGESNACMKRIVAAPTAGSCGVVPAVFLTYQIHRDKTDEEMIQAMYVVAGIGQVIAESASISGAQGGCQAEIGSASAMAAGGIAFLEGGDSECICHAAAFALKNMLGLVCDPVAGLVEVPCVKRNVAGAVNALSSAQMSLAGIRSRIPPDEVIEAMKRVGEQMPSCLRETSGGGLATTATAMKLQRNSTLQ